jgi:caffeoyl-CoA O-methyltransferase
MTDVRALTVTSAVQEYAVAHGAWPVDAVLRDLRRETAALGRPAGMQIGPDQGQLLTFLARMVGARHAVEVGTFTGYSSLCIARALPADGKLVCCDISEEWTSIGRKAWKRAGLADRIDLRLGRGLDTLRELPTGEHLDLVFIDADKESYPTYWNALVPRVRQNGVILVDNTLWSGEVVDRRSASGRVMAEFNDMALADGRVELVILPLLDGLTMARKR